MPGDLFGVWGSGPQMWWFPSIEVTLLLSLLLGHPKGYPNFGIPQTALNPISPGRTHIPFQVRVSAKLFRVYGIKIQFAFAIFFSV